MAQNLVFEDAALTGVKPQLFGALGQGSKMAEQVILLGSRLVQMPYRLQMDQVIAQRTQANHQHGGQENRPGQQSHVNHAPRHDHRIGENRRQTDKKLGDVDAVFREDGLDFGAAQPLQAPQVRTQHAG